MKVQIERIVSNRSLGAGLGFAFHNFDGLAWEAGDPRRCIEVAVAILHITWRFRFNWRFI